MAPTGRDELASAASPVSSDPLRLTPRVALDAPMAPGEGRGWASHIPRGPASPLISIAVVVLAIAAGLGTAIRGPGLVPGLPLPVVPLLVVVLVAFPIWMLLTRRHEIALVVLLIYLGLADGVLKLTSSSELPGLGRDLLLYAIAAGMLLQAFRAGRTLTLPPLTGWVVAFVGVVLVQLANPGNGSWLHSVASLRQHLEFIPLFFIGYAVLRSTRRLRTLFLLLALLATVNGIVSSAQLGLTPEELAAWGPGYDGLIHGTTGNSPRTSFDDEGESIVRPPALGSDMGFGGTLGAIAVPGALALIAMSTRKRKIERLLAVGLFAGTVVAVATSLSRAAIIAAIVGVVAFLAIIAFARPRRLFVILASLALLAVVAVTTVNAVTDGREGDFDRLSNIAPDQALATTIDARSTTFSLIPRYIEQLPLGAGIGSVGPAATVIDPPPPSGLNAESQITFLIVELGIPGLIMVSYLTLTVLWLVLTRTRRLATSEEVLLVAGLAAPLFSLAALWVVGTNTTSSPTAPYFWLATGALSFWLCTYVVREGRRDEATAPGPSAGIAAAPPGR